MPKRNNELLQARDRYVRERFRYLCKKNPNWRITAVIEEVAKDVFLSEVTIVKILKDSNERVPTGATMSKYNKQKQTAGA